MPLDTLPPLPARPAPELPPRADVAIVGAGYTGLAAARVLARRGARVVVLERHRAGWGASTRNGGFVLPGFQPEIDALARRYGIAEARRLFELSLEAVWALEATIAEEEIRCGYVRCGALELAARPGHLQLLERTRRFLRSELAHDTVLLGPSELGAELGSRRYQGGLLEPFAGALQPAALLDGLALAAERAGARVLEGVEVRRITPAADGHLVETSAGRLTTGAVLIATNGYTGPVVPALARRVVPVGSYLIATAPLKPALADRLVPRGRILSDTKHLLYYFRLSPDRRLVFGGRAAFGPTPMRRAARWLARGMVEVFPELAGTPIEYAWGGRIAFTRDRLPHAGVLDGVHYALGYCGHGVALATWLGTRMGEAIAGAGPMPALPMPFRAVPFYRAKPWFLPLVGGYYRLRDRLG